MDVNPVRTRTRAGSGVASLSAQPENGSAPLTDWPEDGQLEDADPNEVLTVPLSQPVLETPVPFGETIQGESQIPVFARLSEFPAQTGMEGMPVRTPNADTKSPLLIRTRPPYSGSCRVQPSLVPAMPRGAGSMPAQDKLDRIGRILESRRRPGPSTTRVPRSSIQPMSSLVRPSTSIKNTAAALADPSVDWVREIVELARDRNYEGPVVGDSLQDHIEKYKVDVFQIMQFFPGPNPALVASMSALRYLTGNARKAVLKFCTRQCRRKSAWKRF
jgi:hypothetical protein